MSDEQETQQVHPSELEREERRLERLRLVTTAWPTPEYLYEEDPEPRPAA